MSPTCRHVLKKLENILVGDGTRDIASIYRDNPEIARALTMPRPDDEMDLMMDNLEDAEKLLDEAGRALTRTSRPPQKVSFTHIDSINIKVDKHVAEKVKCAYCGQYGVSHSECNHCGAPIEGDK